MTSTIHWTQLQVWEPALVPRVPGLYLICLNDDVIDLDRFMQSHDLQFQLFQGHRVLYTGISSKSLASRFQQHFIRQNAGKSTLRKSLGSLFGFTPVWRDSVPNGKTKFGEDNEERLSQWMLRSLQFFFSRWDQNPRQIMALVEYDLIRMYNPPLNLDGNQSLVNALFRRYVSELRRIKPEVNV